MLVMQVHISNPPKWPRPLQQAVTVRSHQVLQSAARLQRACPPVSHTLKAAHVVQEIEHATCSVECSTASSLTGIPAA